jgi:hypothetical protein
MKQVVLVMVLVIVMVFPLSAGEKSAAELEKDKEAVKQAALDYFLGYYEGKAEREERAMHPELVKRGYMILPQTGKGFLRGIGKSGMVELSRAGFGKKQAADKGEIKVTVFEVFHNTASALVVSNHYHDYIHLVKDNGKWQIVNVLWEPTKLPPPPKKEAKKEQK